MIKDIKLTVSAVFCDECGDDVHSYDGWEYVEDEGKHYCVDCAYKLGKITKKRWLELNGICVDDRYIKNWEIAHE